MKSKVANSAGNCLKQGQSFLMIWIILQVRPDLQITTKRLLDSNFKFLIINHLVALLSFVKIISY